MPRSRGLRLTAVRLLAAIAGASSAWTIVLALTGGVDISFMGAHITSNALWRPLAVGTLAALILVVFNGGRRTVVDLAATLQLVTPWRCAIVLAVGVMTMSMAGNSWTASGADAFAYVSQARMFRTGHLAVDVPLAAQAPWPQAVATFAPFGYRAATDGSAMLVPVTTAGLPMLMAAFQMVAGHPGAFFVTPIAGGLLVILTFALGRHFRSPAVGLTAAWLVATSPAFLFMLMWPMSDVPAAAATALMVWLVLKRTVWRALLAGTVAGTCFLLRSNLAIAVAATWVWLLLDRRHADEAPPWTRAAAFAAGVAPSVLFALWLNDQWYGSWFASGYGNAGDLLVVSRATENASRYFGWLVQSSPVAVVGLIALALPLSNWLWDSAADRRDTWLLTGLAAGVASVYLAYQTFDEWWYLRFLLPAWPAVFIGAAVFIDTFPPRSVARTLAVALMVASGLVGVSTARARGVFRLGVEERRYVSVARLVDATTERDAVILTAQHAGTLRYYGGRDTIRFDSLDPAWLDRTIDWLVAQGRHPYVLIDDWEQPRFEARFAAVNQNGTLNYPPRVAWQSAKVAGWTWIFDPLAKQTETYRPGPDFELGQPLCAAPK